MLALGRGGRPLVGETLALEDDHPALQVVPAEQRGAPGRRRRQDARGWAASAGQPRGGDASGAGAHRPRAADGCRVGRGRSVCGRGAARPRCPTGPRGPPPGPPPARWSPASWTDSVRQSTWPSPPASSGDPVTGDGLQSTSRTLDDAPGCRHPLREPLLVGIEEVDAVVPPRPRSWARPGRGARWRTAPAAVRATRRGKPARATPTGPWITGRRFYRHAVVEPRQDVAEAGRGDRDVPLPCSLRDARSGIWHGRVRPGPAVCGLGR